MHHYDELLTRGSNADYDYDMFDHANQMVFDVLMEIYRRFLTSNLGSRYLWKKLLTKRLKAGLIHGQAVARGWLQYRHTIAQRALMLRTWLVCCWPCVWFCICFHVLTLFFSFFFSSLFVVHRCS